MRLEKLAAARPKGIVLREKDLSPESYKRLAQSALDICKRYNVPCILHGFWQVAKALQAKAVHLPLPVLRTLSPEEREGFGILGASCHSTREAMEAQKLGCTYITAGHVFETGCKKGIPGRGLDFLREVCQCVSLPVYGIGGIDKENIPQVRNAGAAGACVMSGAMTCRDVFAYLAAFQEEPNEVL